MPSLIEIVEKINRGESDESLDLAAYQASENTAERFLAHHAGATLQLRSSHQHLLEALKAIGFADRKVLEQYVGLCSFLDCEAQRTVPMVEFGKSAIARGETALGLEALGQAVGADLWRGWQWTNDPGNLIDVAEQYAAAGERIGWKPAASGWSNTQPRIAYIVSSLADDEPAARAAASFAAGIDEKQFRVNVYSTEAYYRRDKQQFGPNFAFSASSGRRGTQILSRIKMAKAGPWIAPVNDDLSTAAMSLADQLVADQVDLVILDVDPSDAIAGTIVSWPVAKAKLAIARRAPLMSAALDGVCYLDASRCQCESGWWQEQGIRVESLVEGIDLAAPLSEAPRRITYGIPESAVILTTVSPDLSQTISPIMVETISAILKRYPQAVYLLVGAGDTAGLRKAFDAAGVGRRVGYAGRRRDMPGFLKMADIYLAEFPAATTSGVLEAMSMGLPTVAYEWDESPAGSAATEFVGSGAVLAGQDPALAMDRVGELIRNGSERQQQGRAMRQRVEQRFSYVQTIRAIESLCGTLLKEEAPAATSRVSLDAPEVREAA